MHKRTLETFREEKEGGKREWEWFLLTYIDHFPLSYLFLKWCGCLRARISWCKHGCDAKQRSEDPAGREDRKWEKCHCKHHPWGEKVFESEIAAQVITKTCQKHPGNRRGESFSLLTPQGSLTPRRAWTPPAGKWADVSSPPVLGLMPSSWSWDWAATHRRSSKPWRWSRICLGKQPWSIWSSYSLAEMNWETRAWATFWRMQM